MDAIVRGLATQAWIFFLVTLISPLPLSSKSGIPCLYEGHLKTDRNWFGFLANITIMATGRMTFKFTYPADKCCQNILFYLEDQMSILNARMNCWQKESLLRPEDDQILRLTPRFSWSGCHMIHPKGMSAYTCEGGRSFTSSSAGEKPTTWYLAVSNCASLMGLELKYRIEVVGHIGECKTPVTPAPTKDPNMVLSDDGTHSLVMPGESAMSTSSSSAQVCAVEGELNTTTDWYGYIANVTLKKGGGFRFKFSYPTYKYSQNVLLYGIENVMKLRPQHSCWQKEGVIKADQVNDQILDLTVRSSWNGCVVRNSSTSSETLVCQGERRYNSPRRIFIAVSNCRTRNGLYLKYRLEFFGYNGRPCAGAKSTFQSGSTYMLHVLVILFWTVITINKYSTFTAYTLTDLASGLGR